MSWRINIHGAFYEKRPLQVSTRVLCTFADVSTLNVAGLSINIIKFVSLSRLPVLIGIICQIPWTL